MRSILILAALIGLAAGGSMAATLPVETYTLPNGLTVILHEDHSQPMVTINTWFAVGSKDESPGRTGFAHLFEHLMFMGTERVPDNQFDMLMERGGGANNASTSNDRTNYYSWGPRSLLPTLLWLDADRLEGLSRAMTQEKLDLQRNVVRNERRQSYENQPYGAAELMVSDAMWPQGHPYHHPVIGSHEDLEAATVEDVKGFFDTYYVPGNASLVVAGDFDPAEAKKLIASTFGAVPVRPLPEHRTAAPVTLEREVRRLATDRVRFPRLYLVWHSPAAYQDGDADMDVLSSVLAAGTTGRLVERLVMKDQLAQQVQVYQDSRELGSEFHIEATAAEGADLEHIKQVVLEEIARLQKEGPTAAELARVKAATESGYLRMKENLDRRADLLNAYRAAYGEANSFDRDLARRLAPTSESVQKWAREVLGEGRLDLRVLPLEAEATTASLDQRPGNLPEIPAEPAVPVKLTLKNGQPLYVVSKPGSGLFSGHVIIDGGERLLDAGQAGLASLSATLVTRGAGKLDATAYADAVTTLGARIQATSGTNSVTLGVSGLTSRLDATLALMADALLRPTLGAEDFDREKELALAGIRARTENAGRVAQAVGRAALYGAGDPRGRPSEGYEATVAKLTREDVTQWTPKLFAPARATLVFAGDFTPEQIKAALDRALGAWKGGEATVVAAPAPLTAPKPGLLLVDRPGAPQTVISIWRPVTAPDGADRVKRQCVNTLFGASFTSRLNQNIREKNGFSYGARSGFAEDAGQWVLTSGSSVQTKVTGPALTEFKREFEGLATGNVTADELEKAVRTVRFELETSGETTAASADVVANHVRNGRPSDAVRQDLAQVPGIDLAAANALARSGLYRWDDLLVVLVGDKAEVLPQLAAAGFPVPKVVDADGQPLP
ncbi:MAG: insulinase family protein [bacterium]|jgi:zinc protease|nr:insulinase family protein [bacterium]